MRKKIFITHCSGKKKNTDRQVTPDELYTGTKIQRFMNRCKQAGVSWAIFSDQYNIWFSHIRHGWYEKHPDQVTPLEFKKLVKNSAVKLKKYGAVYFYGNHRSHYFHPLYKEIINALKKRRIRIAKIHHLDEIT